MRTVSGAMVAASLLPAAAFAQQTEWDKLPRMQLERQFAGPLRDTLIQRWRDPADGSVCYIYLPITAPHTPPSGPGFVQYGPNTIGSISCTANVAAPAPSARPAPQPQRPAAPAAPVPPPAAVPGR
jgi:hypothetical protein